MKLLNEENCSELKAAMQHIIAVAESCRRSNDMVRASILRCVAHQLGGMLDDNYADKRRQEEKEKRQEQAPAARYYKGIAGH